MREVSVKIGLKQDEEEGIVVKALLYSGVRGLVMSSEFAKKNKFKKKKTGETNLYEKCRQYL